MRRLSIRTVMAFIAPCALGLRAMTSTDDRWAAGMVLLTLTLLCGGLLGAMVLRDVDHRWCLSLSAFCGAYFLFLISCAIVQTIVFVFHTR
jgi:hypothetical protein